MEDLGFVRPFDVEPRWVDAPSMADVDVCDWPDVDSVADAFPRGGLSVAETLLAVSLGGPGPGAQHLLASLVGGDLSRDDALTAVQLWEVQEAWLVGQKHLALVGFAGLEPVSVKGFRDDEETVHELAPAWSSTVDFAGDKIVQARLLSGTLSKTGDLLRAGRLSPYLAWMICDRLGDLPVETAQRVEAWVLPKAPGSCGKNLSRRLRTAVVRADPARAEKQHREGRKERAVWVDTEERMPGLLGLQAHLPPGVAIAIEQRLEQKAAEWAAVERAAVHHSALDGETLTAGDGDGGDGLLPAGESGVGPVDGVLRTKSQRMADALAWYVLGPDPEDPTRPREPNVSVQVTADLPTLIRLRDNPAHLDGFGPIPPEIAREWAVDADWQLLIHEPVTGHLLNKGRRTHHPGTVLGDYVASRDIECRFPGCTRRAKDCDDDHTEPFNHDPNAQTGGDTSADNLAELCRRGHRAKTFLGFSYRHLGNGVIEWTTPLGRKYRTSPHNYNGDDDSDPEPPRQ